MKTGERISRFGRPQKEATQDAGVIPTDVSKFVSKHSPKRLKPKQQEKIVQEVKNEKSQQENIPYEDKENKILPETLKSQKLEVSEEKNTPLVIEKVSMKSVEGEVKAPLPLIFEDFEMGLKDENENDSANVLVVLDDDKGKQDFSDTDSALGSATSCKNEAKGIKSGTHFAGQILWGSFSKLSWFPCMAYPIDDEENVVTG